jgi:hypothetical protein
MKWLFLPLLWLVAACIAVAVLWRWWRGKNVVLTGRFSPRLVRLVAIILVTLGFGFEREPAAAAPLPGDRQPDPADEPLPEAVEGRVEQWLVQQLPSGAWVRLKQELTRLPQASGERDREALRTSILKAAENLMPPVRKLVEAEVQAAVTGRQAPAVSATDLLAALDFMEARGHYDHWLAAWLWRKTSAIDTDAERRGVEQLFARLQQHARVTNALILAQARVKPVQLVPRPWMGKAGPPRGMTRTGYSDEAIKEMTAALKQLYPTADIGTWKRDGVALLTLAKDSPRPTLLRGGKKHALEAGETVRLGRLDLIETPAGEKPVVLEHAWLGPIALPAGRLVGVWDLARLLPEDARVKVQQTLTQALANKEIAADRLEQALPLVQRLLREELARNSAAPGAPRLRLILALFDDAVMPPLVIDPNPQVPGVGGFGGGPGGGGFGGGGGFRGPGGRVP